MLLFFKQRSVIRGTEYANGKNHEVPDEHLKDAYFLKLVSAGKVVEPQAAKVISTETPLQRSHKLLEKLAAAKAPPPAKPDQVAASTPPPPTQSIDALKAQAAENAEAKKQVDADALEMKKLQDDEDAAKAKADAAAATAKASAAAAEKAAEEKHHESDKKKKPSR